MPCRPSHTSAARHSCRASLAAFNVHTSHVCAMLATARGRGRCRSNALGQSFRGMNVCLAYTLPLKASKGRRANANQMAQKSFRS